MLFCSGESLCYLIDRFNNGISIADGCGYKPNEIQMLQNALPHLQRASSEMKQCADTRDDEHIDRLTEFVIELNKIELVLKSMIACVSIGLSRYLAHTWHHVFAAYSEVLIGFGLVMRNAVKYCLCHDTFHSVREYLVSAQTELDRLPGADSLPSEDHPCDQPGFDSNLFRRAKHSSEAAPCDQPEEKKPKLY